MKSEDYIHVEIPRNRTVTPVQCWCTALSTKLWCYLTGTSVILSLFKVVMPVNVLRVNQYDFFHSTKYK